MLSAIFAVNPDPLATVTGGSSAITFLALPEVFAQAPGGAIGPLIMTAMFFLALSFAALTSMISTVELCVRNFVDHGYERERSVLITGLAIFIFGLPSAILWINSTIRAWPSPNSLRCKTTSGATASCSLVCSSPSRFGSTATSSGERRLTRARLHRLRRLPRAGCLGLP
ncbi:MAG: hypothetical protein CM15mP78_16820 [Candidatus Poseidoniales archaeon]|nr:MAG: hypothetical protein CM15mP78_16820 [Candidatus Poseidoniales archaeon]